MGIQDHLDGSHSFTYFDDGSIIKMSRPNASYPTSIWDGSSANTKRVQGGLKSPDWRDWDRVTSEMIAVQEMVGVNGTGLGAVLVLVTGDISTTNFQPTNFSVDTSLGDVSITLGDPATYGAVEYTFTKTKVANSMVLVGTISGQVNWTILEQYSSISIYSDGTEWLVK